MGEVQQVSGLDEVPAEVVTFLESVPLFTMLEFSGFPEARDTVGQWKDGQAEFMETDPTSTNRRVLTVPPDGLMLTFDLRAGEQGFPLRVCDLGFPDEGDELGLGILGYLDLAVELAPLDAQMLAGTYPYDEIVAAIERRGLRTNEYWSEYLDELAGSRDGTEERMRYIRDGQ